jgi:restriction system protein
LDLIYIQAKRFANGNKVTRHDLQAFIGAMKHINKGVFITTSSFTRSAIQFIEKQQQKNIKLIDGNLLADLLVKYEVGVAAAQTFKLYKLDTEYFNF